MAFRRRGSSFRLPTYPRSYEDTLIHADNENTVSYTELSKGEGRCRETTVTLRLACALPLGDKTYSGRWLVSHEMHKLRTVTCSGIAHSLQGIMPKLVDLPDEMLVDIIANVKHEDIEVSILA